MGKKDKFTKGTEDAEVVSVIPDVVRQGTPTEFLSRFEMSGMARTPHGYCVVTAVFGADGKMEAHQIGKPQSFPEHIARELVKQVHASTKHLLEGKR